MKMPVDMRALNALCRFMAEELQRTGRVQADEELTARHRARFAEILEEERAMSQSICDACLHKFTGPDENRTLLDLDGLACPHCCHDCWKSTTGRCAVHQLPTAVISVAREPQAPIFGDCHICGKPDPTDDCCDEQEASAGGPQALIAKWERRANYAIAESSRIRSVTHQMTGAEERCLARAEQDRKCANELKAELLRATDHAPAPAEDGLLRRLDDAIKYVEYVPPDHNPPLGQTLREARDRIAQIEQELAHQITLTNQNATAAVLEHERAEQAEAKVGQLTQELADERSTFTSFSEHHAATEAQLRAAEVNEMRWKQVVELRESLREAREENAHLRLMTQDRYSPDVQQAFQDRYDEMSQQLREAEARVQELDRAVDRALTRANEEIANRERAQVHASRCQDACASMAMELTSLKTEAARAPLLALVEELKREADDRTRHPSARATSARHAAELEAAFRR